MANQKILIVDDIPENLQLIKAIFRKTEVETILALSGKDALDLIEKHAVVLID